MAPILIQEVDEPAPAATLELTPVESTLRRLLLDVAEYIDDQDAVGADGQVALPPELAAEPVVLRFTGGWVRDKLLGVDSHDIDVAINKMTGYQFGLRLKEYLEIPGNAEKYGLDGVAATDRQDHQAGATNRSKTVGGLHKIEANPEKSKHLETVTTRILGLDIDLVNLRKETYTDDSRNPQMEFGTPEEDAMRRDATVNAMFYNLNTQQIEDFTAQGHRDLQDGLLRTPLEPFQTFKDDPLRVLRLIRFASRLHYTIDPAALAAMREPSIQDALRRKISRERIGVELEKSLRGPDPHEAMRLIFDLGLYTTIFSDPTVEISDHYQPESAGWEALIDHLETVMGSGSSLAETLMPEQEDRYLAWVVAALVPYRDAPQPEPTKAGRKAPPPLAVSIAREGFKSTNKVSDVILASLRNREEISGLVDRLYEQKRRPDKPIVGEDAAARDVLGMAIRRWEASWKSQVVYSMLVDIANGGASIEAIDRKYTIFVDHIKALSLLDAASIKPFISGTALAKALEIKPGPWMKDALEVVVAYQFRHPDDTDAEAAIEEVRRHRQAGGELASSLVRHFLKLTIRPLFAKAKPDSITDSGRPNTAPVPKKSSRGLADESISKSWKSEKDASALDLLQWSVNAIDAALVVEVWPLVVPPLLTLLDDWETKYKTIGADLAKPLLEIAPSSLLVRTGLGKVFQDALMPCLTYIPPITPESESIPLQNTTYPALLALGRAQFPRPSPSSSSSERLPLSPDHIKYLDTILRKGILYGYSHCSMHPRMVSTFLTHMVPIINELQIESVKHLKYILPMLTETLTRSFALPGASAPSTLEETLSAIRALQAVVLNAWPRMAVHRGEVMKGLALCWIRADSETGAEVDGLQREMRECVRMLRAAVAGEVDFEAECQTLIEADGRLVGLLVGAS